MAKYVFLFMGLKFQGFMNVIVLKAFSLIAIGQAQRPSILDGR
jgi:hypothetical protein